MELAIPAHVLNAAADSLLRDGVWVFGGAEMAPSDGKKRITVGGVAMETRAGGTCDLCGLAISNIFRFRLKGNPERRALTMGFDCAQRLAKRQAERLGLKKSAALLAVEEAQRSHKKALRAAAKERKVAASAAAAETTHAAILARLDALVAASGAGGFAHRFAAAVAQRIRSGHTTKLSPAQLDLLTKLEAETACAA